MPFILNSGTNIDKQQLLGEILERDSYVDKSTFEKSKIILNNSLHSWENVINGAKELTKDEIIDNDFVNEIGKKGNIDLSKEYGVNINHVPLLRDSKNRNEFEERLERIKRQEKEEREAGFVSETSDLWATANVATNILTDPLLVPSIVIPPLALSRLGVAGKIIGGATLDMGMYGLTDTLSLLATKEEKDRGDVVGELLINGFLGGATSIIPTPKSVKELKEVEDNLVDWTLKYTNKEKNYNIKFKNKLNLAPEPLDLSRYTKKSADETIPNYSLKIEELNTIRRNISDNVIKHFEGGDIEVEFIKDELGNIEEVYTNSKLSKEAYNRIVSGKGTKEDLKALDEEIAKLKDSNYYKAPKATLDSEVIEMSDIDWVKKIKDRFPQYFAQDTQIAETQILLSTKGKRNYQLSIVQEATKLNPTTKEIEQAITESGVKLSKKQSNKIKKLIAGGGAVALLTSNLQAGTGSNEDIGVIDALVMIGAGLLAIKYRKGLSKVRKRLEEKAKKNKSKLSILSPKEMIGIVGGTKKLDKAVSKLSKKFYPNTKRLHEILFENIQALMSKGATKEAVSQTKDIARNKVVGDAISKITPLIKDYFKETNFKSLNPIKHVKKRVEFYEGIGLAYTKKDFSNLTKSQMKAVTHFDEMFEKIRKMMKEAGVEGVDEMKLIDKYFPRFHKPQAYDYVSTLNRRQLMFVEMWYADAIKRGFREEGVKIELKTSLNLAQKLLRSGRSDSYYDILKQDNLFIGKPDDTEDFFNRAKFRIPIDFNVKPLTLENGVTLNMTDFVETNAFNVMNRYANMSLGHYAFGKAGISNINNYIKHVRDEFIKNGGDKKILQDLEDYTNVIIGKPISDISDSGLHDFFTLLSKATTAQLLHLSGLSALSEVVASGASSLLRGDFGEAISTFRKTSKEMIGENTDSITDEIVELVGYGEKRIIGKETIRMPKTGLDEQFTVGGKLIDELDILLTAQQKVTFFLNQLPALEDLTNILTIKGNNTKLKDHITGKKRMNSRRAETIGLDRKSEDILREAFKKTTNKSMNFEKWTDDEKRVYTNIIRGMQKATTGQSVMGDIPLFIQKSPLLKALTTLLSFPIQSFDNLLLRDLYSFDAESIFRFNTMLVGTAMNRIIRDHINDKDRTDEEFMRKVIEDMPHIALLKIAKDIFDPEQKVKITNIFPTLSVLENAINVPSATVKGDYMPLLQTLSVPIFIGKLMTETAKKPKTNQEALEQLGATIGGLK